MTLRQNDLSIARKGYVLVSVPAFAAALFVLLLGTMVYQTQEEVKREAQVTEILRVVEWIGTAENDAIMALMSMCLNYDESWRKKVERTFTETREKTEEFKALISGFPSVKYQQECWYNTVIREAKLAEAIGESLTFGERGGILSNKGVAVQVQALVQHEKTTRRRLLHLLEEHQKQYRTNISNLRQWIFIVSILAFAIYGALTVALAIFFATTINRRLGTLVDNSLRLADGRELNPLQAGQDEIGRLDRVFHQMALELKEAQEHEKAIVENAIDVICCLDEDFRFTVINNAAEKRWGFKRENLAGKSFFSIVHPDDEQNTRIGMHAIALGQMIGSLESRVILADGSILHVRWSVSWLTRGETFYCVAHDITQRKLAEALLKESEQVKRLIVESMPLGLVIVDEYGCIESLNGRTRQMFGFEDESELIGQPAAILSAGESKTLELPTTEEFDGLEFVETKRVLTALKKNGQTFPMEVTFSRYLLNMEKKTIIVIADITLRQEIEQLKRDFVAMVSHDLRTPLTTITLAMQMFDEGLMGTLNRAGKQQVNTTEKNLERLNRLVNTLLDIEKLEAGQMEIRKAPIDMNSIVSQSVDSIVSLAHEKGISIATELDECEVEGDSSTLIQVLVNLLSNAIKFSPEGSTITVAARTADDGTTVTVSDQGRGIPEHLLKDVFERFKQVEASDRTEKKGSGLGLSICKLIIDAHGGEIGVYSAVGQGSTFWFCLPPVEKPLVEE